MIVPMCAGFLIEPQRGNARISLDILIDAKYAAGSTEAWTHLAFNMLGGCRPSFCENLSLRMLGLSPFPTRYLPKQQTTPALLRPLTPRNFRTSNLPQ